eukprot:evm.model.scf_192EXC.1 EVM.evm.TU.scf_192EXC.1   scf_192EXC:40115-43796(+)
MSAADGGEHVSLAPVHTLCLGLLAAAPLAVQVPPELNIVVTAGLTVYVGSWRSVKTQLPAESMTKKDAMRFPVIGSAVLLGLFVLFKFLPRDLVNAVLAMYFVVLGTVAITAFFVPFILPLFPKSLRDKNVGLKPFRIPYVEDHVELSATVPELVIGSAALGFCTWYYMKKHWFANNVIGIAFAIEGVEHLSLGSVQVGCILLCGLFVYDIFWVFFTPVMVTVAKSFEAPIKLLFPRGLELASLKKPFSMLGLGDIVIPGIFVALILRHDRIYREGKTNYFTSVFIGYILGLVETTVVMNYFNAAQPALLYIVPSVLGAVALHSLIKGEFNEVFHFTESKAEDKAEEEKKKE